MSERNSTLNQRLQQLVQEAQQHPLKSARQRLALNRLIQEILNSRQIAHPQRGAWPPDLYEDLYNEALQKTLMEMSRKINDYNPDFPVMAWVNQLMNWRFTDVAREFLKMGMTNVPKKHEVPKVFSVEDLENQVSQKQEYSEAQVLRELIEEDPDGFFKKEHVKNRSGASFQRISLMVFDGKTWEQISQEFEIPLSTASSFYQRCSHKLIPYFQTKLR
jgi:hypothetical protein